MGISKEDYLKKLENIWSVLRRETSGDFNDLESERLLLAYILGADISNTRVIAEVRIPSADGQNLVKCDYTGHLRDGLQRLITKAHIGIQKEKKLSSKHKGANDKLANDYEKLLTNYKKVVREKKILENTVSTYMKQIGKLEDEKEQIKECMVDKDEFNDLVDEYNELVDKTDDLKNQVGVLTGEKNGLLAENKKLKGQKEQAEQERDTAKALATSRKKSLDEVSGLYEKEKARADKAVDDLVKEREKPVLPVVVTKIDNRAINDLQGQISSLLGEIKDKSTAISNMEQNISDKDKLIADKEKEVQEKQEQIGKLGLRISNLKQELSDTKDDLSTQIEGLQQTISEFEAAEKKVVPMLQQVVYRRNYQGKSITLSDKDIDRVIRCHLNGMSTYQIHTEYGIAESSVKKIVNCGYKSLSATKRILSALHRVNGNWGEDKKDILCNLIKKYEAMVSAKENEAEMVKQDIESRVVSVAAYNQEVQGHKSIKNV